MGNRTIFRELDPGAVADGDYVVTVTGGVVLGLTPAPTGGGGPAPTTALVPLTTTIGGVPQLVWDDNDNLVMTEVPL